MMAAAGLGDRESHQFQSIVPMRKQDLSVDRYGAGRESDPFADASKESGFSIIYAAVGTMATIFIAETQRTDVNADLLQIKTTVYNAW